MQNHKTKRTCRWCCAAITLLLAACDLGPAVYEPTWDEVGGDWIRFIVSDPEYLDYFFTTTFISPTVQPIEVIVRQESGSSPLGVIFGYATGSSKYYAVLLDVENGNYLIGYEDGDDFNVITAFTYSSDIVTTDNAQNTILLTLDASTGVWTLKINNGTAITFDRDTYGSLTGNRFGLFASSDSDVEDFPATPVRNYYKVIQPN